MSSGGEVLALCRNLWRMMELVILDDKARTNAPIELEPHEGRVKAVYRSYNSV